MAQWISDALIGYGTTVVIGVIVSVVTNAPYSIQSTFVYMLLVGLLAAPGAIMLGRNREGWIWPAAGGFISAAILYYAIDFLFGPF